jgi:hypothetical protein
MRLSSVSPREKCDIYQHYYDACSSLPTPSLYYSLALLY